MLEHEITLDGTIVSAAFDDSLEMGIVGTTAGTLWYINWAESTSIRLISGHKNKVRGAGKGWLGLGGGGLRWGGVVWLCSKHLCATAVLPGLAMRGVTEPQGFLVPMGHHRGA